MKSISQMDEYFELATPLNSENHPIARPRNSGIVPALPNLLPTRGIANCSPRGTKIKTTGIEA